MNTKKITIGLILVAVLGLIGWDIYVAYTPQKGDTISEVIQATARNFLVLPFVAGVLMGHLFWPVRVTESKPGKLPSWYLWGIVGAVLVWDLYTFATGNAGHPVADVIRQWMVVPLVAGIPAGHYLWPQYVAAESSGASKE
jgi:xanthosine utilization system XapX-like protein